MTVQRISGPQRVVVTHLGPELWVYPDGTTEVLLAGDPMVAPQFRKAIHFLEWCADNFYSTLIPQ